MPKDGKTAAIVVGAGAALVGVYLLATRAKAAPPVFDPWVYDFNGDGYIDNDEGLKAVTDYYAGIITRSQLDQVLAL